MKCNLYRYDVVLNSPHDVGHLHAWVEGVAAGGGAEMSADEVMRWREFGQLVYDEGATFETK